MNTVFKELSFLGLREQDKITPAHIVSEHLLRDQYTFTDFYKRENDEQYVIDDLYLEARIQEANNKADRKNSIPWREDRSRFDESVTCLNYQNNTKTTLTHRDSVTKKPKGELLSRMKLWLKEKQDAYKKLVNNYNHCINNHKNIKLLPISFYIEKDYSDTQLISEHIKELVNAFSAMLNTLKGRQIYSCFVSYSRVILLDANNRPYLHIIFYYQRNDTREYKNDISDCFIRDMTREWCKACKQNVHVNYMAFNSLLAEMANDDEQEEWEQGLCRNQDNSVYHFSVSASHVLFPFFRTVDPIQLVPIKSHRKSTQIQLEQIPKALLSRHYEELSYYHEKEFSLFVKEVKQKNNYHLYYLEQVAKQYTKIPMINNITSGLFSYKNKENNATR
ncbi:hypothetical protein MWH14_04580 [Providencia stuartii]|uniref:hypothetical protein n=1 Tax=Providencia stuartii TaxID=588 RepID=UPI00202088B5|nr:hypothetical protein [Providencia rettgeri]URE79604.1 hypothetical protein MWH14_04580 [Providencia stuartii]